MHKKRSKDNGDQKTSNNLENQFFYVSQNMNSSSVFFLFFSFLLNSFWNSLFCSNPLIHIFFILFLFICSSLLFVIFYHHHHHHYHLQTKRQQSNFNKFPWNSRFSILSFFLFFVFSICPSSICLLFSYSTKTELFIIYLYTSIFLSSESNPPSSEHWSL